MDDLITFLKARLDERERLALDAGGGAWRYTRTPDPALELGERVVVDVGFAYDDVLRPAEAEHVAGNDPAHALLDIEAKRRIINLYEQQAAKQSENAMEEDRTWTLEPVILLLALPYADHKDYRKSWKP